jgi:3',5'-cyclic AMP phosphodiesterase CpdA
VTGVQTRPEATASARAKARRGRARVAAAALAIAAVVAALVSVSIFVEPKGPAWSSGSTLEVTWTDPDGNGVLERGPGEPLRDRTELAPARAPGRTLATFAQISDAHIGDEESPGRLPVLDRLGHPFVTSFRPQEALGPQVLAGTVAALNGLAPQAVAVTGDLTDSAQANELDQALSVLRGGRVEPDSAQPGYDGVQATSNPDPFFYRPGVDAPRHRGLLDRAQRSFRSPGLRAPWYPATGNHDVLTQGVVAPTDRIAEAATGSRRIAELERDLDVPRSADSVSPQLADRLLSGGLGRTVHTPRDARRRPLGAQETVDRLRRASGLRGSRARLDYSFDIGPRARGIVLDSARRDAGSGGLILPAQVSWLRRELRRAGQRHLVVFAHHPPRGSEGGDAVLELLARDPRVIAVVSGHAHRNAVAAHRSRGGGLWLVETASLADFPQQARAFALRETAGGAIALETRMVDHTDGALARTARELAYLDAQGGRPASSRGRRSDRNVRLHLPGNRRAGPSR